MRIAVFDIDGTLTQSSSVDDLCFRRTARELLGLADISVDWSSYPHSTDDSIASFLIGQARGRRARRDEIDEFRTHFLGVLKQELEAHGPLRPTAGAGDVLERIGREGWQPAVATGCWRDSALAKLDAAGIRLHRVGAAFADDAWPREQIIARAVERTQAIGSGAAASLAAAAPAVVAYVGDGIWDVRASAIGGYRFVGIAEGPRAAALRQEGASTVLAGFADWRAFTDALQNAAIPRST